MFRVRILWKRTMTWPFWQISYGQKSKTSCEQWSWEQSLTLSILPVTIYNCDINCECSSLEETGIFCKCKYLGATFVSTYYWVQQLWAHITGCNSCEHISLGFPFCKKYSEVSHFDSANIVTMKLQEWILRWYLLCKWIFWVALQIARTNLRVSNFASTNFRGDTLQVKSKL